MEVALIILVIAVIFISQSVKFVPQQNAWVREVDGTRLVVEKI